MNKLEVVELITKRIEVIRRERELVLQLDAISILPKYDYCIQTLIVLLGEVVSEKDVII